MSSSLSLRHSSLADSTGAGEEAFLDMRFAEEAMEPLVVVVVVVVLIVFVDVVTGGGACTSFLSAVVNAGEWVLLVVVEAVVVVVGVGTRAGLLLPRSVGASVLVTFLGVCGGLAAGFLDAEAGGAAVGVGETVLVTLVVVVVDVGGDAAAAMALVDVVSLREILEGLFPATLADVALGARRTVVVVIPAPPDAEPAVVPVGGAAFTSAPLAGGAAGVPALGLTTFFTIVLPGGAIVNGEEEEGCGCGCDDDGGALVVAGTGDNPAALAACTGSGRGEVDLR